MPSRFQGLTPYIQPSSIWPDWDHYDNVPLDPAYIAPVSLQACTRKPAV